MRVKLPRARKRPYNWKQQAAKRLLTVDDDNPFYLYMKKNFHPLTLEDSKTISFARFEG